MNNGETPLDKAKNNYEVFLMLIQAGSNITQNTDIKEQLKEYIEQINVFASKLEVNNFLPTLKAKLPELKTLFSEESDFEFALCRILNLKAPEVFCKAISFRAKSLESLIEFAIHHGIDTTKSALDHPDLVFQHMVSKDFVARDDEGKNAVKLPQDLVTKIFAKALTTPKLHWDGHTELQQTLLGTTNKEPVELDI